MDGIHQFNTRVTACAEAAATAAGAYLGTSSGMPVYLPDIPVFPLIACFEDNLKHLGYEIHKMQPPYRMGSSDFGNVSQEMPALMGYISISDRETATHSARFADAASSNKGCLAMAMTAVDMLADQGLLREIKRRFAESYNSLDKIL